MKTSSKQTYNYTVLLEREEDGGYHAFCPILKGCHSQGETVEEAIENITEAIELYLESLIADLKRAPPPRAIVMSNPASQPVQILETRLCSSAISMLVVLSLLSFTPYP